MRREGFGGGRDFGGGGGFGRGGGFQQKVAPVKEGEEVDVVIESVGAKGDGVAKKDGFVIFVPNSSQGDNVRIRITKVLANMAFAEVAGGPVQPQQQGKRQEKSDDGAGLEDNTGAARQPEEQPVDSENFGEED
ncbi:TRAM domain-containing protein [Candidatus Woesearchaeota archaeon]|nr:TRAM domain-containing protein [Candidatus Woesearchaeota archaeon]